MTENQHGWAQGLTLSERRAVPWEAREAHALAATVDAHTAGLPSSWRDDITREWSRRRKVNPQAAARWGFGIVQALRAAERLGVCHGDTDAEICRKADAEARQMAALFDAVAKRVWRWLTPGRLVVDDFGAAHMLAWLGGAWVDVVDARPHAWVARLVTRAKAWAMRADFVRRGIAHRLPSGPRITPAARVSRATDPIFWRRILRALHAKAMEGAAISLGRVRAGRGCYVSNESLTRRQGQRMRNAQVMGSTVALNERGQADTLANIAAKGQANGEVRRAELMTRIAGFEVIAGDLGHLATFVTVTCPSRMHKWKRGKHARQDLPNASFDGTCPDAAQAYMAKQWAKFRAAAARLELGLYGFRIAEPHHDGCPHWHLLLWHPSEHGHKRGQGFGRAARLTLGLLLARYFLLNDSPDEKGALDYRIDAKPIDTARGSAAGYLAKYVAKNIDGAHIGEDLWGNPAVMAAARVEAWATTWRIRQFQQVGGPPVGVWREVRRISPHTLPMEAVQAAHDVLMMANVTAVDDAMGGQDEAPADGMPDARIRRGWAAYVMAQGGPTARRRDHTLQVLRESTGEVTRYGEVSAPKVVGVRAKGWERVTVGIATFVRPRVDLVESERCAWVTGSMRQQDGGKLALAVQRLHVQMVQKQTEAAHVLQRNLMAQAIRELPAGGAAARTWTRVSNCTPEPIGHSVNRHAKQGQVFNWARHRAMVSGGAGERNQKEQHHVESLDERDPHQPQTQASRPGWRGGRAGG